MDFQSFANMITGYYLKRFVVVPLLISGIGHMLQNPMETIDVPSQLMMGRWFQVYKAAVNFDVYRTQMYCPVAYCKSKL